MEILAPMADDEGFIQLRDLAENAEDYDFAMDIYE
jgi:hypothetical protein